MAKAKQQAASTTDDSAKKKATRRTAATATKAPTKSAAAKKQTTARKVAATTRAAAKSVRPKPAAKKPAVKKVVKAKAPRTAAAKTKAPARRTATAKTKSAAPSAAKRARATTRRRNLVVEVTPAVIDTSLAAEVAAALVLQGQAKAETLAQSNTPVPPPHVVKRGSSALRHVKESLANPISRQLDSVLGPLMTPHANAFRGGKSARPARALPFGKKFDPHSGHFGVPRRAAG